MTRIVVPLRSGSDWQPRRLTFFIIAATLALAAAQARPLLATQQPTAKTLTTQQIAATTSVAVVTIITFDANGRRLGQGSGFVVRPDGLIVTNWHVMAGASSATVSLKTGESFDRVNFLNGDVGSDVVLLKIPGFGLRTVSVTADLPEVGSRVVALGSPMGLSGTVSEGIVSAVRLVDGRQLVQITAAISPGSSGGPVIDATGRAFAVATESLEGKGIQQLNFAVPVKYAMGLLSPQDVERPLAGSRVSVLPKHSDFSASAADYASWSRPGRTAKPLSSLLGEYAFVSRSTDRSSGDLKGKNLGLLILGSEVGLWSSPKSGGKEMNVIPVGPLTSGAAGTVALSALGFTFAGYQTDEGFWVSNEGAEVIEIQTKKFTSQPDETNGLYSVDCKTDLVGSISVAGRSYPTRDAGPEWVGEAAIVVVDNQIHIDLLMKNSSGGNTLLQADGPINGGAFDLRDGNRRLTGNLAAGRLQAKWVDERSPNLRFEGLLRAERK